MRYYSSLGLFQPFKNVCRQYKKYWALTWPLGYSSLSSALGNELTNICSTYFTLKCFTSKYVNCIGKNTEALV